MSCGVGRRCGSDPELLWLWCWPAATALIRPLAWEPPYATGAALEEKKKKKKKGKTLSFNYIVVLFKKFSPCLQHVEVPGPGTEPEA